MSEDKFQVLCTPTEKPFSRCGGGNGFDIGLDFERNAVASSATTVSSAAAVHSAKGSSTLLKSGSSEEEPESGFKPIQELVEHGSTDPVSEYPLKPSATFELAPVLHVKANHWYECTLVEVLDASSAFPATKPDCRANEASRDLLDSKPWSVWHSVRLELSKQYKIKCSSQQTTGSKEAGESGKEHLPPKNVSVRVLKIIKPRSSNPMALIWCEIPAAHFGDNQQGYSNGLVAFINSIPVKRLGLPKPCAVECPFECGGTHMVSEQCPAKLAKLQAFVKEQREHLRAQGLFFSDPEFPCGFASCTDMFHLRDERCEALRLKQDRYECIVRARTAFESGSRRPTVRVMSWNTQKTSLAARTEFLSRKGFTEFEKSIGVGGSNLKRALLDSEIALFETLVASLVDDIKMYKPDIFVFQEFGPRGEEATQRFLARLGLDDATDFSWSRFEKVRDPDEFDEDAEPRDLDAVTSGPDESSRKYEQHLFVWRNATMAASLPRAEDFLKVCKHGSPTLGLKHLATGKLFMITSLHLRCGSRPGIVSLGQFYQDAVEEFTKLLKAYQITPKRTLLLDEEWSCKFERDKVAKGDFIDLLCGDLNCNPHLFEHDDKIRSQLSSLSLTVTGNRFTVTNAGSQPRGYDFFILSESMLQFATASQKVLRSSSTKTGGNIGISDHDPVLLEIDFVEKVDANGTNWSRSHAGSQRKKM